MNSTHLFEL